jgi:hypothetical protein
MNLRSRLPNTPENSNSVSLTAKDAKERKAGIKESYDVINSQDAYFLSSSCHLVIYFPNIKKAEDVISGFLIEGLF